MRMLYDIKDKMEDELKKICRKEDMSQVDLDNVYKMIDIVKDVTTIEAMNESDYSKDYSKDYSRRSSRDDGYSRSSRRDMIDRLTDMMHNARTEDERENYRKTIEQLNR